MNARLGSVHAERRTLEAAVAKSRADPRASIDHAIVREGLLADAKRAQRRIALNESLAAADVFLRHLDARYPVGLAILFGSRARGDHDAESDADLAVILDGPIGARSTVAADMAGVAFHAMLETGVLVDPLPLWRDEFESPEEFNNPALIENILREGVPLERSARR
jgi:predicted nucleotidyltransferase